MYQMAMAGIEAENNAERPLVACANRPRQAHAESCGLACACRARKVTLASIHIITLRPQAKQQDERRTIGRFSSPSSRPTVLG